MTAVMDNRGVLIENAPGRLGETQSVRRSLRVTVEVPKDPSREQCMKIVEASGTLDFWHDPEENVYTDNDGHRV